MQFRKVVQLAVVVFALIAAGNVAGLWSFADLVHRGPTLCLFKRVTGLDCPGCGMTRSLAALSQGDLLQALRFHPFGPPFLAWMLLYAALPNGFFKRRGVAFGRALAALSVFACTTLIFWWLCVKMV